MFGNVGPWGYFGCRACDKEWLDEHPLTSRDTGNQG